MSNTRRTAKDGGVFRNQQTWSIEELELKQAAYLDRLAAAGELYQAQRDPFLQELRRKQKEKDIKAFEERNRVTGIKLIDELIEHIMSRRVRLQVAIAGAIKRVVTLIK